MNTPLLNEPLRKRGALSKYSLGASDMDQASSTSSVQPSPRAVLFRRSAKKPSGGNGVNIKSPITQTTRESVGKINSKQQLNTGLVVSS